MFGWFKRKPHTPEPEAESAPATRDRYGDYDGKGIWVICPDCGNPHKVDETPEFRALLERLCTELGDSSRALYEEVHILGQGRWDIDPETATFTFTDETGRRCHARYGFIASWNDTTKSWMWAWGLPEGWDMPEACLGPVRKLHEHAQDAGWDAVTSRMLLVESHEAWHLTKLAAHVNDMPLVYSAKVNPDNRHFYALERPRWSH